VIPDKEMQQKIKWLKWMIVFCNTDLTKIRGEEKENHFFKVFAFTSPYALVDFEETEDEKSRYRKHNRRFWLSGAQPNKLKSETLYEKDIKAYLGLNESNLELVQEEFKALLEYCLSGEAQSEVNAPGIMLPFLYRPSFYFYQDKFKIKLGGISSESSSKLEPVVPQISRGGGVLLKHKRLTKVLGLDLYGKKRALFLEKPEKDFCYNVLRKFCELLDDIPTGWIRKCKGCERFFFHSTRIEKIYCFSACAARSIQRIKREKLYKNPEKHEAHNKKMRKIMKKKYEDKQKAKGYKKVTHYKKRRSDDGSL
jgi:hypothetical protein